MLLQNGITRVPAGTMSSVETSSPVFSATGSSTVSGKGCSSGMEAMLAVFSSAASWASVAGSGGTRVAAFTGSRAGSRTRG